MTDYLPTHARRGHPEYVPEEHHQQSSAQHLPQIQDRGRRAPRIQVARAFPEEPTERIHNLRNRPRSVKVGKLAGSRENAKRFLRSVIAPHSSLVPVAQLPSPARADTPDTSSLGSGSGQGGEEMLSETLMRNHDRTLIGGPVSGVLHRPPLVDSVRTASGTPMSSASNVRTASGTPIAGTSSVRATAQSITEEKPLAAANGISVAISLAEPILFLRGFEQDTDSRNTAMLRGSLHLRVIKSAKIKAVTLKFKGRGNTKWPEGIPPRKTDFEETDNIMSHTWPFFNAQFPTAEAGPCADRVELFGSGTGSGVHLPSSKHAVVSIEQISPSSSNTNLSSRDQRKLSLQLNQSRSFGKGESPTGGPSVAQKGYRTFLPGDYLYNFELPIDSSLPETIDVELGSVKYELEAIVERAGAFKTNLIGSKEVTFIRVPAESSLEQVEPIAISRSWEDQLHYDIVISGKSFPLGAQIPIAFKLTPLAKVQCHRVKVFVTENIEYFCSNKRVHRLEPTRKVQLFEKRSDGASTSAFPGSTIRVTAGGGIPYDQRAAAARGEEVQVEDTNNLLGNLQAADVNIGPTEIEVNAQLPSCYNMREKDRSQRLHFDTTYANIQVHHWIKIVMRLSKPDTSDPSKRRHFEISIDSPFHVLSCRATQANTALPAYSSPEAATGNSELPECGCPGAPQRRISHTPNVPTLNSPDNHRGGRSSLDASGQQTPELARPQQAHIPNTRRVQRPMHMLRAPSFNPPPFDAEDPPPPLVTPPPQYDTIASPSNGLADYFARVADAYEDESDEEQRRRSRARVDVPLTPGGRSARSMDVQRTWLPLGNDAQ